LGAKLAHHLTPASGYAHQRIRSPEEEPGLGKIGEISRTNPPQIGRLDWMNCVEGLAMAIAARDESARAARHIAPWQMLLWPSIPWLNLP